MLSRGYFLYARVYGRTWNSGIAFRDGCRNNRKPENWRPTRSAYLLDEVDTITIISHRDGVIIRMF